MSGVEESTDGHSINGAIKYFRRMQNHLPTDLSHSPGHSITTEFGKASVG